MQVNHNEWKSEKEKLHQPVCVFFLFPPVMLNALHQTHLALLTHVGVQECRRVDPHLRCMEQITLRWKVKIGSVMERKGSYESLRTFKGPVEAKAPS